MIEDRPACTTPSAAIEGWFDMLRVKRDQSVPQQHLTRSCRFNAFAALIK
jgi:hypothetical protein